MRGPANEIGSEEHEGLLKVDGWFGADFEVMQVEDLLALLNASLNRLPAVVPLEPLGYMLGHGLRTKVKQGAMLERFARVEPLQSDIQSIGAVRQAQTRPGQQFGIGPHSRPGHCVLDSLFERGHDLVA